MRLLCHSVWQTSFFCILPLQYFSFLFFLVFCRYLFSPRNSIFFFSSSPCVWVTCSEPRDWTPATGHGGCPRITTTKPTVHLSLFFLSVFFLFQGHGLHLDKLITFLSLSNCCFRVTGGSWVSPGMITEVSLSGLVKLRQGFVGVRSQAKSGVCGGASPQQDYRK